MWLHLLRKRARAGAGESRAPTLESIRTARHILFAVFGRYGDSVIAFKLINEFVQRYPDKRYTLLTTRQARPYAQAIVGGGCEFRDVNKRRDPLKLWRLVQALKRQPPDLGFNPWSHGEESEFFVSYCRQFHYFRHAGEFTREVNLYARVRGYLQLPTADAAPRAHPPATARHIVLSPFSTDVRKRLAAADIEALLSALRKRFAPQQVTIAGFPAELAGLGDAAADRFSFSKSAVSSERFLELLHRADLFVGVDAGPLHLADALGLAAIGLFGPTTPETILDRDSGVQALRHASLQGVFCDVTSCRDPLCVHAQCARLDLDAPAPVRFGLPLAVENTDCPYLTRTRLNAGSV